jgi:hypothetical protein
MPSHRIRRLCVAEIYLHFRMNEFNFKAIVIFKCVNVNQGLYNSNCKEQYESKMCAYSSYISHKLPKSFSMEVWIWNFIPASVKSSFTNCRCYCSQFYKYNLNVMWCNGWLNISVSRYLTTVSFKCWNSPLLKWYYLYPVVGTVHNKTN